MADEPSFLSGWSIADLFPLFTILFYVISCPYTKVEESFNMQAIHDLLTFQTSLGDYDHLQFPGVVPRTFIGAILVSVLSFPFHCLLKAIAAPGLYHQIAVRCVLGAAGWISLLAFRRSISSRFGSRVGQLFMVLTGFQFHMCFYMSRTLPNTFALLLCLWAYGAWLDRKPLRALVILAASAIVFRCDVLILIAVLTCQMLLTQEIKFIPALLAGIATGAVCLTATVLVDSYFWQRWLWPEGVVLFFNTVENRSSAWGVMPWHWYLTAALPKALNVNLLWIACAVLGLVYDPSSSSSLLPLALRPQHHTQRRLLYHTVLPAMAFVMLYSLLPHKELRFIFPALPLLTLAAASGLSKVLPGRSSELIYPLHLLDDQQEEEDKKNDDKPPAANISGKHEFYAALSSGGVVLVVTLAMLLSSIFLSSSMHNYPGGMALERLLTQHIGAHSPMLLSETVFVHIDPAAAMTGVTRFTQERILQQGHSSTGSGYLNTNPDAWTADSPEVVVYSKDEARAGGDLQGFHWIITPEPAKHPGFAEADRIYAFSRLSWARGPLPQVIVAPALYIMRRVEAEEEEGR